jgi:hypothetical protein
MKRETVRIWNEAGFISSKILSGIRLEKLRKTMKDLSQNVW